MEDIQVKVRSTIMMELCFWGADDDSTSTRPWMSSLTEKTWDLGLLSMMLTMIDGLKLAILDEGVLAMLLNGRWTSSKC